MDLGEFAQTREVHRIELFHAEIELFNGEIEINGSNSQVVYVLIALGSENFK